MKNYITLASVLGAMVLAGCAGAVPKPAEPANPSTVSLTDADLGTSELAPSPYLAESSDMAVWSAAGAKSTSSAQMQTWGTKSPATE